MQLDLTSDFPTLGPLQRVLESIDRPHIDRLADDVLVDVMCMLPLCDLLRCRRVNRRFRALGRKERVDRHLMACLSSLDRLPDYCLKRIVNARNACLFERFIDASDGYPFNWNMLMVDAACVGSVEMLEQLVRRGAKEWTQSITAAANRGHRAIAHWLIVTAQVVDPEAHRRDGSMWRHYLKRAGELL